MRQNHWEYKIVKLESEGLGLNFEKNLSKYHDQLNQLGKLGWELVTLSESWGYPVAYLKR